MVGKLCQPDCSVYRCVYPDGSRLTAIERLPCGTCGTMAVWWLHICQLSLFKSLKDPICVCVCVCVPLFHVRSSDINRQKMIGKRTIGKMQRYKNGGSYSADLSDPSTPIGPDVSFVASIEMCTLPGRVAINKSAIVHICIYRYRWRLFGQRAPRGIYIHLV